MTERTSEISQQPESLVQPEPVLEIPQVKNRSFFKAVLLMVLGLLIVAGAVYAGTRIGKKQITPSKIIAEPTLKPVSPTPDPTADWKTYRSEYLGFEFKYPKDWEEENYPSSSFNRIKYQDQYLNPTFGSIGGIGGNQTIENYCSSLSKIKIERAEFKTVIDGIPMVCCYQNSEKFINLMYQKNDKQYGLEGKINDLELFNQILSTFKFTNEDNTVEGRFCGGIAANLPENQCPEGYDCKLDGNYPDASGKCLKK